jgi:hypothetical protein
MLPALRYRGPLYCAPDVNRDNAHDPDRLVSDSGRMTGKAGGMPPVGQIAPDKRAAVQEIQDMIMLFAAANGGRSSWQKADVIAVRRPSSNYPIKCGALGIESSEEFMGKFRLR